MASTTIKSGKIPICFVNNNSKKWDGKIVDESIEWLSSVYPNGELAPGKELELPYEKKHGIIKKWNAVIVDMGKEMQKNQEKEGTSTKAG